MGYPAVSWATVRFSGQLYAANDYSRAVTSDVLSPLNIGLPVGYPNLSAKSNDLPKCKYGNEPIGKRRPCNRLPYFKFIE